MDAALGRNIVRVRGSRRPNGMPQRVASSVCVPKMGRLRDRGRVGPTYDNEEFRQVSFGQIRDVAAWLNTHVYVRVGSELRQYTRGAPMGEPGSCSQANGVTLDAEQTYLEKNVKECDEARVATLGFVDDMHFRFFYDVRGRVWPRADAVRMCEEMRTLYPPPLSLE